MQPEMCRLLMGSVAVPLRLHIVKTDSENSALVICRLTEQARNDW
jgi:hypothetical protein